MGSEVTRKPEFKGQYLYIIVAAGESQVNNEAKLLIFFVQSVQQLPVAEDVWRSKLAV